MDILINFIFAIQKLCLITLAIGIIMYFLSKTEKYDELSKKIMLYSIMIILIGFGTCLGSFLF
ncbi:MAG: hypothetical protein QM535_03960 [Limnohabitans sp.]|nr:hypothetical protein [Limnohabitans sp.]